MPVSASDAGFFQCGSCKRTYTRLDHLSRHVRSHTQSRPYKCYICTKGFARTDLLKRHIAGHESQAAAKGSRVPSRAVPSITNAPGRVTAACKACASNHVRCTEEKPCHRCVDKGLECDWNTAGEANRPHTPPESETQAEDVTPAHSESQSFDMTSMMEPKSPGAPLSLASFANNETMPMANSVAGITPSSQGLVDSSMSANTDSLLLELPDLNLLLGQVPSPGPFDDLGVSSYTGLDDMDMRFLDTYNINVPFEIDSESYNLPHMGGDHEVLQPSVDPGQAAAMCSEAFMNSHWHFRPNVRDHGGAEEHNLSLPPAMSSHHLSVEARACVDTRATCAKLGVAMRDRILTIIIQSCRPENLSMAVASFPSIELLDTLLQYYLMSPITKAMSFLHAPTFDPNERRPELVAAMVASGAVLTSDPALTKLGYAIQECIRVVVPKHWENDNSTTRDLQLLQTFLITLDIGLWSGYPRKVEIAESFLQPLLTMLRRAGKLGRSAYPPTALPNCQGDALEAQWTAWVECESFKRLAFRLLLHDADSSMALEANPLISYAEFTVPLPGPTQLWSAGTAERWKAAFPDHVHFQAMPVIEFLDDPQALGSHHDKVDTKTAGLAVLSFAWSLVREFTQLSSLQRMRPRRWSGLVAMSRMEELRKLISSLRVQLGGGSQAAAAAPEMTMRLELVLLHLHMPFEEIHIFAGKDGPEQARSVYAAICEWVQSEAARRAVSHAGQIIRVAKTLPKASIRGPAAIMVYHASLALWVYGMVSRQQANNAGSSARGEESLSQRVWLDEAEDVALQRFIDFGSGEPCIGRDSGAGDDGRAGMAQAYLSRPGEGMEVILRVLGDNFDDLAMPLLAKKLLQLMLVFQRCS